MKPPKDEGANAFSKALAQDRALLSFSHLAWSDFL
jgi:hypothetical protein